MMLSTTFFKKTMNLNPVEWSQAQDLLLKLVRILAPLTEDRSIPISSVLSKRFFAPPTNEDFQGFQFRNPVRILTNLHNVQKQVEELIGEPSIENFNASKQAFEPKKVCRPEQMTPKPFPPLSKQAQKLINQVQDAIGKLCSSTNIKKPDEAPLRETLKQLKPSLDRMIEAVTHKELHPANDSSSSFRLPISRSLREEQIIKKVIPLSDAEVQSEKAPSEVRKEIIERTSLPIVPFIPDNRSLSPARKKKKRKGFWFRDNDDDRNNS